MLLHYPVRHLTCKNSIVFTPCQACSPSHIISALTSLLLPHLWSRTYPSTAMLRSSWTPTASSSAPQEAVLSSNHTSFWATALSCYYTYRLCGAALFPYHKPSGTTLTPHYTPQPMALSLLGTALSQHYSSREPSPHSLSSFGNSLVPVPPFHICPDKWSRPHTHIAFR